MNIQLKFLFLFLLVFFGSIHFHSAESQTEDSEFNLKYAQLIVRDSDGNLVTYLESTRIISSSNFSINDIINDTSTKIMSSEIMHVDGKPHEIIVFERTEPSEETLTTRGMTYLNVILILDDVIASAFFSNNGYFLLPDDERMILWTAIRPI